MSNYRLAIALDEFQQTLTPDQTAQLKSYSNHAPTPNDVVSLTDQVIQANASRKTHIFASRLQGLLGSIQQYCNIIDTCVGPNQIAALVWGSIKLVILTSSNFSEYFEKLSERIAQLSNYCPRFSEYDKLFPTSIRLQQALSDFYAVVVSFCSKALHVIQERGAKRFSKSIWKSFKVEFKEIEESISEAKDEVAEELALASEQEAHEFRGYLTAAVEENNSFRIEQRAEIEASRNFRSQQRHALQQTRARQIQKIVKEEERQKIRLLQLIPSHDYALSLRRARGLRCEGTCDWLLQRPEFREWVDRRGAKHLWCYGIPGCGKSVLMGHAINHLSRSFAAHSSTVIIYYFFDYSKKKSLQVSAFLRCVLHQVITVDNLLPESQRSLESLFEERIGNPGPAIDELERLVCHFIAKYESAFLLIDGLDEVSETERRNVKSVLKTIQKKESVRILAMTHAAMDMTKVLTRCSRLQIKPDDLRHDITTYVQLQIDTYLQSDLLGCSSSALDLVKRKLVSDAEGMFLWVDLHIKAILDACEEDGTPDRIPDLLETLPQGITELYSLLLHRVTEGSSHQAERAKKAFQWAIYGRRPLAIEELQEAVSITAEQKSWTAPSFALDASRLSRMCANLIDHDEATKQVVLAHHSVESFFRSEPGGGNLKAFSIDEVERLN
ncbi:hypothetical protein BU25DRAFT_493930 [Macroventuria anomochaeta]|uniref:Uncharacterized protein n=1 Tax=Macroventuria anomochaeta TaxID=301207 RepID=A0ACB6RQE6_9PLEO|nr:uncharacterized protein BU25DRAFT_493930 [Macroventuria anomochaeta]KAF2624033.1 hypothetical protein BU25DRAFT_493930 [Macroventuria anomochaeta]